MQIVTGPLLMYRLTGSTALLGTMALVSALPVILISMFGGAVADRIPKKRIIMAGFFGSAVVAFGIAMLLSSGIVSPEKYSSRWIIIGASLCSGSLMGFMMPSVQSLVAEIVNREQLMNAVALNTLGMNILSLIAPSIAGFMIDAIDFEAVYFSMSGLYLCGVVFIFFVPATSPTVSGGSIVGEIQQGFQYIKRNSMILSVLVFSLIVTVLSMPYQQLLPVFVDDILGVGATGMGILMSVSGAGALIGSITLTTLANRKRGLMLLASGLLSGTALVAFSFSTIWGLSLGTMVFIGIGHSFRMTIGSTLLQAYADPEYRGRVMSIYSMQWGLMSIFTFFAGVLGEAVPVQWILGSLATLLIILSILALSFVSGLRRLD